MSFDFRCHSSNRGLLRSSSFSPQCHWLWLFSLFFSRSLIKGSETIWRRRSDGPHLLRYRRSVFGRSNRARMYGFFVGSKARSENGKRDFPPRRFGGSNRGTHALAIISLKCCRLCNTNTKGFREIMTFSTGSHIWGNDCPVILVSGVLFTVATNPAVQIPIAATSSSYLQQVC
jgi:hypothetical protein